MKWELALSPEPATTIATLRQRLQGAWNNVSQDNIRHFYDRVYVKIHAYLAGRWGYTVY